MAREDVATTSKNKVRQSVVTLPATSEYSVASPTGNSSSPFVPTGNYVYDVWSTSLYKLCRPFLILMRLGGLFFIQPSSLAGNKIHDVTATTLTDSQVGSFQKWEKFERASMWYSFIVLGFGLAWAGKFIYSMVFGLSGIAFTQSNLSVIVSHCGYLCWVLQINITQMIFLRACLGSRKLPELFMKWETLRYSCAMKECDSPNFGSDFRWRRNLVSFLAILHCVLQWMSADFPIIISGPNYAILRGTLMEGVAWDDAGIIFLNLVSGLLTAFIYVVPAYFFTLIAVTLTIDFHHIQNDMHHCIKEDGVMAVKSLEWFRIRHNSLCVLVDLADEVFCPWIALTLGCNVVQILCQIFLLAGNATAWTVITDLTQTYWMLTYFLQLLVILYRGALVNEAAHGPLHRLYQLDQSRMSIPEALQLQTFLNRLTTNPIGFTAWRLLPINYEALLLMLGTYVTYQLLLFQLQLDLGLDGKVDKLHESCLNDVTGNISSHMLPEGIHNL
ncbi:hypothetical protein BV898_12841 [Hypsibius exemplaris]|uniref:Gustatory receptor n=1 Tax=Hypsibius exemplaris TaxID=2072580 RepID=A0A1W0WCK9_HYPEX|nr:hypothetical protein BV898_12841 [Hypsibius exemplaris]